MSFGMDVVILEGGSLRLIESNPQGNSGFLATDYRSHKLFQDFLNRYPEMLKNGDVSLGMNVDDQLAFLKKLLVRELKMDLDRDFPHLEFHQPGITYREIKIPQGFCQGTIKRLFESLK